MQRLLLSLALVLTGCATLEGPEAEEAIWRRTVVSIPTGVSEKCNGNVYAEDVDRCKITGKRPVVIFLHGCAGMEHESISTRDFYKNLGYIVVSPDSLATGRQRSCPTPPIVVSLRLEELERTLGRVKRWDWADHSRMVLAGHSEGGIATAFYAGTEFKRLIITGWICSHSGIRSNIPSLLATWRSDPWYGQLAPSKCGATTLLVFEGRGHSVVEPASVSLFREAVIKHLEGL